MKNKFRDLLDSSNSTRNFYFWWNFILQMNKISLAFSRDSGIMDSTGRIRMIFDIPAVNMPILEKRLKRIEKKCQKYGCTFKFEKLEEIFKPVDISENRMTIKFVRCDIEGTAIIDDWQFIAIIDHTPNGNIIKKVICIDIPEKFRTTGPICEHCNINRFRNSTYVIKNIKTGEFKQVGKSCLLEYTGGLSSEHVAAIESLFHEVRECENIDRDGCSLSNYSLYEDLDTSLLYAIETIKRFGYHRKSDCDGMSNEIPTGDDTLYFMSVLKYNAFGVSKDMEKWIRERIFDSDFDIFSDGNVELKDKIKKWVSSSEDTSDYIHNLKVLFSDKYVGRNYFGILVSSVPAYYRANPDKTKETKESEYVGTVGDKISIEVKSIKCVFTCESFRRIAKIYRITDKSDNIFIWRTSIEIHGTPKYISGTIKEHSEYRGVKQTVLTRCKIID